MSKNQSLFAANYRFVEFRFFIFLNPASKQEMTARQKNFVSKMTVQE
jgi:hypothetical protein